MRKPELIELAKKLKQNCQEGCSGYGSEERRCPFYIVLPNGRGSCLLGEVKPRDYKV